MTRLEFVGNVLVMLLLVLVLAGVWLLVFIDKGPSCEDQGGKSVFSHTTFILTGKIIVPVSHYNCEMPEQK